MVAPDEDNNNTWILQEEISKVFKTALKCYVPDLPDEVPDIEACTNKEVGDYQRNNHLTIWKQKRDVGTDFRGIKSISEAICKNLPPSDLMEECSVFGIGVLTFTVSRKWIAKSIHKMLIDGIDTWAPKLPMKKAIVDFSSRDIVEEMNVGHLRSAIIGETFSRMLEHSKVDVLRRSHVRDMGTQFGMLIEFLFERFSNAEVDDLAIGELEVLYKESKKRFDEDAEFKERAQQAVVRLQAGDERYRTAQDLICVISRKDYEKLYQRLGVHVEEKGKSFYHLYILRILDLLRREEGLLEENNGDQVIFIEEEMLNPVIVVEGKKIPFTVVKRDGAFNHSLTDLAALWYQLNEEKAEWLVYVDDVIKDEYTEMYIAAAKHAGWLPADEEKYPRTKYVGFGLVQGDDLNRFRTHSNEAVKLVDLLDEAKTHCKSALVEQGEADKHTDEELEHIAEALGCGAVKYADLRKLRLLNFTVNFDQMLSNKGNTVVYLLYTHAQICSIITESGKDIDELKKLILDKVEEQELGLHLLQFTEVLELACTSVLPDILCEYLYKLSEKFVGFHSECQVVGLPEETSRLLLCEATAIMMRKCFYLLGITPIYKI